jgi:hypothetical protein
MHRAGTLIMSMRWIWSVAVCAAGMALGSCLALCYGAAEAAGVEYRMGSLSAGVDASARRTFTAAQEVVEELELTVVKAEASEVDGEIIVTTARERKITLRIDAVTNGTCELSIRVGSLGDEDLSIRIYERILRAL